MALRVEQREGLTERQVVIGCVVSKAVLGPVAARWKPNLFPSRWSNLVVGWCVSHYNEYRKAPGKNITGYFDEWMGGTPDRDTAEIVEAFLYTLSEQHEQLNEELSPDYLIDAAGRLFQRHQLEELKDRIAADLEMGHVEKAQDRVDSFHKIELGLGTGIDVLSDDAAMEAVFDERSDSIITYPDAAGAFFDRALRRGSFVGLMGKNKIGKSYWAGDMAWRAVEQGRNTAYFEVGDQTQPDVLARFASRWCNRPVRKERWQRPKRLLSVGSGSDRTLPDMDFESKHEEYDLDPQEERIFRRRWAKKVGENRFKLSCHPNNSISVAGIESIMEGWQRYGWVPDVVVVDYADILAPLNNKGEERDQINHTWMALRAIPQRWHCCLVTPTQADTASFDQWLLTRKNFTGDRRKLDHVTAMMGINQTSKEKDLGLYRLNWVSRRDLYFAEDKVLWCASELSVANPVVLSTF